MSDASLEIQGAIVTRLKADSGVSAIVGTNVLDSVPTSNPFPRITIGAVQVIPDEAQDYFGSDVVFTLDGWSRSAGFPEVKRIGKAIAASLQDAALTLSGYRLIEIVPDNTQYLRDQDGLTSHGIFVYRARTEPA